MRPPFADPHKRLERMVFFSDAVFAIVITLLAFEIKLPEDAGPFRWEMLLGVLPAVIATASSFFVIGIAWWVHTRMCERLIAVDGGLLAVNAVRLFFVTLIPFPTWLISRGDSGDAWAFYGLVMAMSGFAELAMWRYLSHREDLVGRIDATVRVALTVRVLVTPIAYLVSAAAGSFSFHLGWIVLGCILGPAHALVGRWTRSRESPPAVELDPTVD